MTSQLQDRLVAEFVATAERFQSPGFIEWHLWETLQGMRKEPVGGFFGPLNEEERDILRLLHEAGLWVMWKAGKWVPISVEEWEKLFQKG